MFSRDTNDSQKVKLNLSDAASNAKEKVTEAVEHSWEEAKCMLEKAGCDLKNSVEDTTKMLGEQVKKKPLTSVGISMLVGALIVLLIKR